MGIPCLECGRRFAWGEDADSAAVSDRRLRNIAHCKLAAHARAEHPGALFTCPRRGDAFAWRGDERDQDYWYPRDGYPVCHYCGSISEAELFSAIERGGELSPTDKSYKVYVTLPAKNPDEPVVYTKQSHEPTDKTGYRRVGDLSAAERDALQDGGWSVDDPEAWVRFEPRGPHVNAKFYFQHLSEDGRARFVTLLNAKKINLGYPGHFYRLPFFCKVIG